MPAPYGSRRFHGGRRPLVGSESLASWYVSGSAGDAFDPASATTMFEDRAGAVPATIGSRLGRIVGAQGQHYMAAATDNGRPTYAVDGEGRPHIVTASSNFMVSAATLSIQPPLFLVAALSRPAMTSLPLFGLVVDGSNYARISNVSGGNRCSFATRLAGGTVASVVSQVDAWPLDRIEVVSAQMIGGVIDLRVGDIEVSSSGAYAASDVAPGAAIQLNANTLTSGAAQVMQFYGGAVFYGQPSPRERDEIHGYYKAKLGL